jgi:hypothetical protein
LKIEAHPQKLISYVNVFFSGIGCTPTSRKHLLTLMLGETPQESPSQLQTCKRDLLGSNTSIHLLTYALCIRRYLNKELTLQPAGEKVAPRTVKLHDLENLLSSIIASMFWTRECRTPISSPKEPVDFHSWKYSSTTDPCQHE